MTEYEILSLMSELRSEGEAHAMHFFTVWSAFLLVTYLVGEKLHKAFALVLSILYTFYLLAPASALFSTMATLAIMFARYETEFPDSEVPSIEFNVPEIIWAVYLFSWLSSLAFLIYTRHKAKINASGT